MRHQAQVVADQQIPGAGSPGPAAAQLRKGRTFLIRGQGPREGPTFQMQCQVQNMPRRRAQKQTQNAQHTHHLAPMYAGPRAFMLRQRAAMVLRRKHKQI